ncbi:MAG: acyclic terpene utilization AtuA family protein [Mesorhizobium sp.]
MKQVRIVSTAGILGYGFPEASLAAAMERGVDMVGVDAGSTDPGPYYLGSGKAFVSERAMKRDLRLMLRAAIAHKVPMMVGSCGGAGAAPHLELVAGMVREIAAEEGLSFKMALIPSEQSKADIRKYVASGRTRRLGLLPELDEATVDRAERIVAVMGPEPFRKALEDGAQVILAGRSSDPAIFSSFAMHHGLPPAPAWYAGKMLECGPAPTTPKAPDCLRVVVTEDSVDCEPMGERACTPMSVINHSLHENHSPLHHIEPGGTLHTEHCSFVPSSNRATRVSGMTWEAQPYSVKLEAAEFVGYRAVSFCATRDPGLIAYLKPYLARVRELVGQKASDLGLAPDTYTLTINTYGQSGVMGATEPQPDTPAQELAFFLDVVARTQEEALALIALLRTNMLHTDFPGRLCKEGNMAFPLSPSDLTVGPVYRFSMQHVVLPDDPCEMFPISYEMVGQ